MTYYDYPHATEEYKIEMREDYSIFNGNLNDGDYDYMIVDHSIPVFDEYYQESDNDHYMIENDSPPTFNKYYKESEEFRTIEKESSPLFDDYLSESDYEEFKIIEDHMPQKYDENSLDDECEKIEIIKHDSHALDNEREKEYYEFEIIEDNKPRVSDQQPIEQEYYALDFIDDYIYDMFAQRLEKKYARARFREYIICNKLNEINSRMKERKVNIFVTPQMHTNSPTNTTKI